MTQPLRTARRGRVAAISAGAVVASSLALLTTGFANGLVADPEFVDPGLSRDVNPVTALTADSFAAPPIDDWPLARYNYPATASLPVSRASSRTCTRTGSAVSRSGRAPTSPSRS